MIIDEAVMVLCPVQGRSYGSAGCVLLYDIHAAASGFGF